MPRLRFVSPLPRMFSSIFVKCALVMAVSTAIVAVALLYQSSAQIDRIVRQDVQNKAYSVTHGAAANAADAIRFKAEPKIDEALRNAMQGAGKDGILALAFDGEGQVLRRDGADLAGVADDLATLARTALASGETEYARKGKYLAVPVRKIPDAPPLGVVAMAWTAEPRLASAARAQREAMLQAAAIFAVLLIATMLLLRYMLGRPLSQLAQSVERIGDGDYQVDIPTATRGDELGSIGRNLVGLTRKLDAARAAEAQRQSDLAAQTRMVAHLGGGLVALADGIFTRDLQEAFPEDYETLRGNYNRALSNLRQAIREVAQSADSIRNGAEEISRASDDLSHRTETQAATLEQTSAALDMLANSVKEAADSAREVDVIVRETNDMAARNGTVMQDAISAMSEIEKSSEQINEIIGVIDDIAFQTNLLALNAGVEAARAGSAGKGFAVVASEVRGLAQRSSEAARQIKTLISGSTQQVKNGAQLVDRAGEALMSVVGRVDHISDLVAGIAERASSQASSVDEINLGVTNLDQVTQQNAAMVEQSTAAAHLLKSDVQSLNGLVRQFSIDADDPPAEVEAQAPTQTRAA